ncbi:glycerol dehydrogenase [Clostridium sp. FP2]|uniref:glycerol dehydrogenase n=1 Tax=Clostridium sp. FP2 TaxID=2724481 RepID=UPI0013E963A3|nr:glycerol dehydrogenase [Clostridium sp. FP2]MBZ9622050.1 glycerol dehydrogenase [Clostridium sp. FP2]
MKKMLISPSKYIQGQGELCNLGDYVTAYGKKVLFVAHKDDQARVQKQLDKTLEKGDFELVYGEFKGECTINEIERLRKLAVENECDVFVGLGGGKAIDTAKSVAHYQHKAVIVIPTIAATDAPCSSSSVIYTENGEFQEYMYLNSPNVILVDTEIIAKAPTRFLVSGMGDALSTYFEARSCLRSFATVNSGGKSTKAAFAMAKLCYETLLEDSVKAKAACDANVVTKALENIIETNILLSGIGFESGGLAAAHAIHDGLTVLEETHKYYHGEKVAFGTIVHLVLENAPKQEIDTVLAYCKSMGLPTCLKDLGVNEINEARLMEVAKLSCADGESMYNMPFKVTAQDVYAAILTANILGGE